MANELFQQIEALVEREALAFHKEMRRHPHWWGVDSFRRCRAGHLFGICMALKAMRSDMVTDEERRATVRLLRSDVKDALGGDKNATWTWMQAALSDAASGQFRPQLVAPFVERLFRGRPKAHRPQQPATANPPTPRVIQGRKKGGRNEEARPATAGA